MSTYDQFSKNYFPAFWYAMGKLNDDIVPATEFGNWHVEQCREAGLSVSLIETYAKWAETH